VLRGGALLGASIMLVGIDVWLALPRWRDLVFDENRIVEDLTFGFYVLAFVVGLAAAIGLRGRYRTLSLAAIPATALLFAGEEVDWGFLLFDWHEPHLLGDPGFNLHDLPDAVGEAFARGSLPSLDWIPIIAVCALAVVGARAAISWYRRDPLCSQPAMALLGLTLALVGLAKLVDVHAVKMAFLFLGFNLKPVEEGAELAASAILALAALRLYQIREARSPTPSPTAGVGLLLHSVEDIAPETARARAR